MVAVGPIDIASGGGGGGGRGALGEGGRRHPQGLLVIFISNFSNRHHCHDQLLVKKEHDISKRSACFLPLNHHLYSHVHLAIEKTTRSKRA